MTSFYEAERENVPNETSFQRIFFGHLAKPEKSPDESQLNDAEEKFNSSSASPISRMRALLGFQRQLPPHLSRGLLLYSPFLSEKVRDATTPAFPLATNANLQILHHNFSGSGLAGAWVSRAVALPDQDPFLSSPPPRFGHTAVLFRGAPPEGAVMVVFGGKNRGGHLNDLLFYDVGARAWAGLRAPPSAPSSSWPSPRAGHTAVVHGRFMYVLSGGVNARNDCADDLWRFDLRERRWALACARLPFPPRRGHSTHVLPAAHTGRRAASDLLVTFGGLLPPPSPSPSSSSPSSFSPFSSSPSSRGVATDAVVLYEPASGRWSALRTCGERPRPRFYHAAEVAAGTTRLFVFGGRTTTPDGGKGAVLADFFVLDVATGVWREVRDAGGPRPPPRMCGAAVFANGLLAVFAGGSRECACEGFEFCPQTRRWRRFRLENEPPCSRPTVVYAGSCLLFYGGCDAAHRVMGDALLELPLPPLSLSATSFLWLLQTQALVGALNRANQDRMLGGHPLHGGEGFSPLRITAALPLRLQSLATSTPSPSAPFASSPSLRVANTSGRGKAGGNLSGSAHTNASLSPMNSLPSANSRNHERGGGGAPWWATMPSPQPNRGGFSPHPEQYPYCPRKLTTHHHQRYHLSYPQYYQQNQHPSPLPRTIGGGASSSVHVTLGEGRSDPYLLRNLALPSEFNY